MIRTRFAPSPSGLLHIGGARTAALNLFLAKKHGGQFVLRFEDTDINRSSIESAQSIMDSLKWLGLNWDVGPGVSGDDNFYFQSNKIDLYQNVAQRLINQDLAYPCFCSIDDVRLQKDHLRQCKSNTLYDGKCSKLPKSIVFDRLKSEKHTIRLRVPRKKIVINDLIKGEVVFDTAELEDFIIIRSNGYPMYNFSCVVDDVLMKITHVLRGDEHLSNTPKQALIYESLAYPMPSFGHVPIILDPKTGKKMSKRDSGVAIEDFRNMGHSPSEVLAYIFSLGCKLGKMKRYDIDEFCEKFDISKIDTQPSCHSLTTLNKISEKVRKRVNGNKMRN